MFFKKKSPALPSVRIEDGGAVLYEGLLKDLPIKEAVILEKSVHFFDDPEPCYIHRNAVRMRLTQELLEELISSPDGVPGANLLAWADFSHIERCTLL